MTDPTWLPETEALVVEILAKRVVLDPEAFVVIVTENVDRWSAADRALFSKVVEMIQPASDKDFSTRAIQLCQTGDRRAAMKRLHKILTKQHYKVREQAEKQAAQWIKDHAT